ncbi:hypothetical protein [Amycolatopsis sp. NPDC051061]|uniref:hypothetical protein n=1 Tax=Amycolatopsis sp. NPDC051061 TaxID=3155042 RepID=UPI0034262DD2
MSWWDIGGDDVLGDDPLDTLGRAFSALARQRTAAARPKPRLAEVLAALAVALGSGEDPQPLVAHAEARPDVVAGRNDSPVAADVTAILSEAISDIEHEYEEAWSRSVRLTEVVAAVETVLGADPGEYLSDGDGLALLRIEVAG